MKRFGFLLLRGVLALVGTSLVATASAQVDPLAPFPEAPVRAATPAPPPTMVAVQPQPSFVLPAAATGFEAYKARLASLARSAGVREATIPSVIPYLCVEFRVEKIRPPPARQFRQPQFPPAVRTLPSAACHRRPDPPRAGPLCRAGAVAVAWGTANRRAGLHLYRHLRPR